jgi:hypothetical protein
MRSISEARRNRASAAADNSKLHGCGFELEIELEQFQSDIALTVISAVERHIVMGKIRGQQFVFRSAVAQKYLHGNVPLLQGGFKGNLVSFNGLLMFENLHPAKRDSGLGGIEISSAAAQSADNPPPVGILTENRGFYQRRVPDCSGNALGIP